MPKRSRKRKEPLEATGLALVDALANLRPPSIEDYVRAASEYVRRSHGCTPSEKKSAQIRLSDGLATCLTGSLKTRIPNFNGVAGERRVSGGLRDVKADVSEFHETDGLRLAVELKPVNLAVGRAIWNRFGDIRAFAVNLHLKFPFAVVGGVLVIPTYEEQLPKEIEDRLEELELDHPDSDAAEEIVSTLPKGKRKDTTYLIARAVDRLARAGGRIKESDAAHLLEGVCVLVYDPETGTIDPNIPGAGRGLRWDEFISSLVAAYDARFGEVAKPDSS